MEYSDDLDDTGDDDFGMGRWVHNPSNFHGYPRLSDMRSDRGFSGNHTRSSRSVSQPPLNYYSSACDLPHLHSVKVQAKESVSPLFFYLPLQVRWPHCDVKGFYRVQMVEICAMFVLRLLQDTGGKTRLIQETKKSKERAEKKRLKKLVGTIVSKRRML